MNRVLVVVCVLAVLVFSSILGRDLIDYRISELDFLLEQAAEIKESSDTLSIVGKYELIRRRIERGENALSNYTLEARTVALSTESILSGLELRQTKALIPLRFFLRPLHFVMGKSTFDPQNVEQQANFIEIAYYRERSRDYKGAIESYETALSKRVYSKPDVLAAILLHQGFCHSMLTQYADARVCFQEAIERYPETDAGILAWKLLDFLDSLEEYRKLVQSRDLSVFEAGRQAYFLMDYRSSIAHLNRYLDETEEEAYAAEARYFKARSHEELGEIDEALKEYEALICAQDDRQWAVEAGRRVYMLGVYYGQGERIGEESRAQVAALGDSAFLEAVSRFAGSESMGYAQLEEPPRETEIRTAAYGESVKPAGEMPPSPEPIDPLQRIVSLLEPQGAAEPALPVLTTTRFGGLDIENTEAGLTAYLDGVPLGGIDHDPFENIEPGVYQLELRGDGQKQPEHFGATVVSIKAGVNIPVFVEPLPYGGIEYRIPEGATAIVEGSEARIPVTGEGTLRFLAVGEYRIEVAFPGYPATQQTITLGRNQTFGFFPSLPSASGSGVTVAGRQTADQGLPPVGSPPALIESEGSGIANLSPALITSEQRNREVRIDQLRAERIVLVEKIEKVQRRKKAVTTGQWVSYGTGLAALGGMGVSLYFGNQSYQDYQSAIYTEDAVALRKRTQLFQGIAITSGILGGIGIASGTVLLAINPNLERMQRRISRLNAEIERLEKNE